MRTTETDRENKSRKMYFDFDFNNLTTLTYSSIAVFYFIVCYVICVYIHIMRNS